MGAKVNTMNYHGNTPLHYLAKCRIESPNVVPEQIEVLKLMIESGANLDFKNSEGETPLHFSILASNAEFVKCLIYSLCNVCAINKYV
jgi:ankyrin repeat protein